MTPEAHLKLSDRGTEAAEIQRASSCVHCLDKPERRVKKQVKVDYCCFNIPDEFVVGYGLDYAPEIQKSSVYRCGGI